jgi:hypothetical protein
LEFKGDTIIKCKDNFTIDKVISFFTSDSNLKSIIELDLNENDINEIGEIFFHFRKEHEKLSQEKKAFI